MIEESEGCIFRALQWNYGYTMPGGREEEKEQALDEPGGRRI